MTYWIHLILILSFPFSVMADNSFADYFEYESSFLPKHADEITQFFTEDSTLSSKKRLANFKNFNDAISIQIKQNPKKAVLWFAKGLNFKNRLLALDRQKTLGARNIDKAINQTRVYMQKSFVKAMQLDSQKKPNLSAKMYGTMKNSLESNHRIDALQHELSLGGSGDNETHYWFSHWDVIGSLQDEGRLEEAEIALNKMQNELKASGLEQSPFSQIYQQAKGSLEQEHVLSPLKNTKVLSQKKIEEQPNEPLFEAIKDKFETYWFMIIINLFVFISLIFAFVRRNKD